MSNVLAEYFYSVAGFAFAMFGVVTFLIFVTVALIDHAMKKRGFYGEENLSVDDTGRGNFLKTHFPNATVAPAYFFKD